MIFLASKENWLKRLVEKTSLNDNFPYEDKEKITILLSKRQSNVVIGILMVEQLNQAMFDMNRFEFISKFLEILFFVLES